MEVLDCRGLACPAPVISVKKHIEEAAGEPFRVMLDKGAARENVLRYCASQKCTVIEEPGDDSTSLLISGRLQSPESETTPVKKTHPVLLITSDRLGDGPEELGRLLLKNFIITLNELQSQPEKIICVNSGVFLTAEGSEVIIPLSKLADAGVEILSCGVCLNYYGLSEKLAVGRIGNMYTIAESLLSTSNAIRL